MTFLQRLKVFASADPFTPFRIAASSGESWIVETRECLTRDCDDSMLTCLVRDLTDWRYLYLRASQLVSIDLVADGRGFEEREERRGP